MIVQEVQPWAPLIAVFVVCCLPLILAAVVAWFTRERP